MLDYAKVHCPSGWDFIQNDLYVGVSVDTTLGKAMVTDQTHNHQIHLSERDLPCSLI